MTTPKRRSFISLIFTCLCITKPLLISTQDDDYILVRFQLKRMLKNSWKQCPNNAMYNHPPTTAIYGAYCLSRCKKLTACTVVILPCMHVKFAYPTGLWLPNYKLVSGCMHLLKLANTKSKHVSASTTWNIVDFGLSIGSCLPLFRCWLSKGIYGDTNDGVSHKS